MINSVSLKNVSLMTLKLDSSNMNFYHPNTKSNYGFTVLSLIKTVPTLEHDLIFLVLMYGRSR